jgi:glycosyltransferase involved in cell wall biosynthesis
MNIAMIGQRGLPATFGGVERHVEELGSRLVSRGHQVTVFCRTNYTSERRTEHRGMRLRHLPTVNTKHFDAIAHSVVSSFAAMADRPDIIHYHALGPGLAAPLPRLFSTAKVVLTVHGLDHQRSKWGVAARQVLKTAAWTSARVPDTTIVVSQALADHYARCYGRDTVYVPNGVDPPLAHSASELDRFGLSSGSYVLFVGRLVPEKAPDVLIKAFRRIPGDVRLVVAGGSSFTAAYARSLRDIAAADDRVVLPGYVYGSALQALYANAAAFVLPSTVEGLPLTLLEAASHGTPVLASDIPPHIEILGTSRPGHRLFPAGDEAALATELAAMLAGREAEAQGAAELSRRVMATYHWDAAARAAEELYLRALADPSRQVRRAPASETADTRQVQPSAS